MIIVNETELMNNQKASTTVLPDLEFEALQTAEGNSLLFSVSSKKILFCTCEVPGDTHGWIRTDISSALSARDFGGQPITVKSFDLGQNLSAATIDLVMVITDSNNKDWLYTSLGNSDANWVNYTPNWQQVQFDDPNNTGYANDPVNDVFVARFGSNQFIFADLITNAENQALSRYAIDPTGQVMYNTNGVSQCWIPHSTESTLQAGHISSAVGCGPGDESVYGIYTLYAIDGNPQLVYAPLFNQNEPGGAPNPTDFDLKTNITSIDSNHMAMAVSKPSASSPDTDLFFASEGVLYFCANGNQVNQGGVNPVFTNIYSNDLFQNIQSLHISNWNQNIVLWGQSIDPTDNTTSRLFAMECLAGQEGNPNAWSYPIPLLLNAANSTTYINNIYSTATEVDSNTGAYIHNSCSVIFAEQVIKDSSGNDESALVQLFQDPVTTAWQQRFLLSAPLDVQTEIFDNPSYSTHIEVMDAYNNTQINAPVAVWASSPCSVYVNDANNTDAYFTLDPVKPLLLTTDITGNVTIMQQVDSIGGISYYVAVQDLNPTSKTYKQLYTQPVNPAANTISRLNTQVPDGKNDYLKGKMVTASDGTQSPLVSSEYTTPQPNNPVAPSQSTSNNINTICQQNGNVNSDGLVTGQAWPDATAVATAFSSVQSLAVSAGKTPAPQAVKPAAPVVKRGLPQFDKKVRRFKDIRFNPKTDKIWGWKYGKDAGHFEGIEAVKALDVTLNADGSLSLGSGFHIEAKLGHIVKWMKSEAHKLETAVITFTEGVIDCVLTIAGDIYHFVAKCANDLVSLVHTVLNAVETAFDDVIKWIGFIFEYKDILNTHNVMKNLIVQYLGNCVTNASSLKGNISGMFTNLQDNLNQLVGLPQINDTQQSNSAQASKPASANTPQANWGTHKLKSNGGNADSSQYSPTDTGDDPTNGLLAGFNDIIQGQQTAFATLQTNLQSIFDNFQTLTMSELFEQVLATITDFLISEAGTVLEAGADVLASMSKLVTDTLTAPINIPVISWLYGKISGGAPFSILDLGCLIAAIPATIVYKVIEGAAPYPDSDLTTQKLISAPDLATIQGIWAQPLVSVGNGLLGHGDNNGSTNTRYDTAVKVSNIFGMIGSVGVSICTTLKSGVIPGLKDNKGLNIANSVCFLMYVLPDATQSTQNFKKDLTWYNYVNDGCTWFSVLKTGVDALTSGGWKWTEVWGVVSPWTDFVLNILWQVPTCAGFFYSVTSDKREQNWANQVLTMAGGTAFDCSGMLSPALWLVQQDDAPPSGPIAIGVACAFISLFNVAWGASCILESWGPLTPPPPLS